VDYDISVLWIVKFEKLAIKSGEISYSTGNRRRIF